MTDLEKLEIISEIKSYLINSWGIRVGSLPSLINAIDSDSLIVMRGGKPYQGLISELPVITGAYTDAQARAAMGVKDNSNPYHHDRYTDSEAITAMGSKSDSNPLNHDRYTDSEVDILIQATINDSASSSTTLYSSDKIVELLALSASYGIKYIWADETARNAQTGMVLNEQGLQQDARSVYGYDGATWIFLYSLDEALNQKLKTGTLAAVPTASNSKAIYICIDYDLVIYDNGSWNQIGGYPYFDTVHDVEGLNGNNNTDLIDYLYCRETNTVYEKWTSLTGAADDKYIIQPNFINPNVKFRGILGKYIESVASTVFSKYVNITTSPNDNGSVNYAHGMDEDDIINVTLKVKLVNNEVSPSTYNWITDSSDSISLKWNATNIVVTNNSLLGASVNNQTATLLIHYKE